MSDEQKNLCEYARAYHAHHHRLADARHSLEMAKQTIEGTTDALNKLEGALLDSVRSSGGTLPSRRVFSVSPGQCIIVEWNPEVGRAVVSVVPFE